MGERHQRLDRVVDFFADKIGGVGIVEGDILPDFVEVF
jgi:hypothetical protein